MFPLIALITVIVVASRRANMKFTRQDFADEAMDVSTDEADVAEFSPLLTGPEGDPGRMNLQMKHPRHNRLWPDQFKHTIYLATEIVMMFLAIAHSCLRSATASGPRYEINFLDVVLNSSRGTVLFLCFGTDERLWLTIANALSPLGTSIRKFIFKTEKSDLRRCREWLLLSSSEGSAHAEDFTRVVSMLARDRAELERTLTYGLRKYKKVFTGKSLVDWIVEQGIKGDRNSAEMLGRTLLLRGAFGHVKGEHHFYDEGYFYRFGNLDGLQARLGGQGQVGGQANAEEAGQAFQVRVSGPRPSGSRPTPPPRSRPMGLARRGGAAAFASPTPHTLHG